MSTTTPSQKSTAESVPATASLIGVDGRGERHYLSNPVTSEGLPVLVTDGDDVDTHDLAETHCADQPDAVEAWVDHVARKRGEWEFVAYGRSLGELLAEDIAEAM